MKYIRKTSYDIKDNYALNLLVDRGIIKEPSEEQNYKFFNPSFENLEDPYHLDNIDEAANMFLKHLEKGSHIRIYVDSDPDGFTSASVLYNYMTENLKELYPNFTISYHIPDGKEHGLEMVMDELTNSKICDLIIMPDSSSNDYEEHKILKEMGYDIIVLDHHNASSYSENAIVVNNQLSERYENKMASGVGIVFKFLQVVDKKLNLNAAIKYIDLVALGVISDMMSMYTIENRFICDYGLSHITNPLFCEFVRKQAYSLFGVSTDSWVDDYLTNGKLTQIKVAFYITPRINAEIRVGSQREKELLFEAFIDGNKEVNSTKRGEQGLTEMLSTQVVRNCENAKTRQNTSKDKAIELLDIQISNNCLDENKIIVLNADELDVSTNLTGLIAMGIAAKYKKPTLIGRTNSEGYLKGSIRGCDDSELKDFRQFLLDSGFMEYVEG